MTNVVRVPVPLPASGHKLYVAFYDPHEAAQLTPHQPATAVEVDVYPVIGWLIDAASPIFAPDPLTPLGVVTHDDLDWAIDEDPEQARRRAYLAIEKAREKGTTSDSTDS